MSCMCATRIGLRSSSRRAVPISMIAPPLIAEETDIDEILERLADAVRKLDASPRVETA